MIMIWWILCYPLLRYGRHAFSQFHQYKKYLGIGEKFKLVIAGCISSQRTFLCQMFSAASYQFSSVAQMNASSECHQQIFNYEKEISGWVSWTSPPVEGNWFALVDLLNKSVSWTAILPLAGLCEAATSHFDVYVSKNYVVYDMGT